MTTERVPMTKEQYEKLKAETDRMVATDMIEVTKRVATAPRWATSARMPSITPPAKTRACSRHASTGRSDRLARAVIVDPSELPSGTVVFGARVRVKDLGTGEVEELHLVGPGDEDYENNKILTTSPRPRPVGQESRRVRRDHRAAWHSALRDPRHYQSVLTEDRQGDVGDKETRRKKDGSCLLVSLSPCLLVSLSPTSPKSPAKGCRVRADGRQADELRPLSFQRHYTGQAPGSVLVRMGRTTVLCTCCIEEVVPPFLVGTGKGWLTAEYGMLPGSTGSRKPRDRGGKIDGRSVEIQRLIGRSLRAVVDLEKLGERTLWVDCDVLEADGGTRTAAINGAFVAVVDALTSGQSVLGPVRNSSAPAWRRSASASLFSPTRLLVPWNCST